MGGLEGGRGYMRSLEGGRGYMGDLKEEKAIWGDLKEEGACDERNWKKEAPPPRHTHTHPSSLSHFSRWYDGCCLCRVFP